MLRNCRLSQYRQDSVVRVLFALITLVTAFFPCLIAYIVMAVIMPDESEIAPPYDGDSQGPTYTE